MATLHGTRIHTPIVPDDSHRASARAVRMFHGVFTVFSQLTAGLRGCAYY